MSTPTGNANVIPLQIDKSSHVRSEILMKESLARLPRPAQRMREVAQSDFKSAIQNLFDHVDDSLFELADRAVSNLEQNVFFESMREIRIQRRAMEKTFLRHIDRHFVGLVDGVDGLEPLPELQSSDSFELEADTDDLSLVSKEELEELVAIDSLVSKAWAQNKNTLRVITARINTVVSVAVSEKNNPLTPRALADSFLEAAALITVDIKAKLVLFKLFERYVINELGNILNKVNHALTEEGVAIPKSPSRRRAATNTPPSVTPSSATPNYAATSNGAPEPDAPTGLYATLQSLLQAQPQNTQSSFTEASYASHEPSGYSVTEVSYALMSALSQLQQQQVQQEPVSKVGEPQLLSSSHIQSAIHSATGEELVDERSEDVIKLVDMLFSFIMEDQNLPDPVKLMLSRLQIPFIKVALADEEFFKKEGHPARRLLNEMAMASIGWSGDAEGGKRDTLLNKIESTVNKILNEFDNNFEIFTLLLTDFIAFMEKERRRVMLFEKRAIDAEDGKAKSEVGRQQVDSNLSTLLAGRALPEVFTQFIQGPWSNILFLIYMRQGKDSQQWGQALRVAKELVWSAATIQNDEHKRKLTALVPRLKMALKNGLENISFNPVKQAKFIEKFDTHYQVLFSNYEKGIIAPLPSKSNANKEKEAIVNSAINTTHSIAPNHEALKKEPAASDSSQSIAKSPNTPPVIEQVEQIMESAVDSNVEKVAEPPKKTLTQNKPESAPPQVADTQYSNLVDNFTVGVWFEKSEQGSASYRCRLAAIIRGTGKYIFVNRAGVKVAEETKESLALQLQEGKLRTLDDGMLFDRALESVITNLRSTK